MSEIQIQLVPIFIILLATSNFHIASKYKISFYVLELDPLSQWFYQYDSFSTLTHTSLESLKLINNRLHVSNIINIEEILWATRPCYMWRNSAFFWMPMAQMGVTSIQVQRGGLRPAKRLNIIRDCKVTHEHYVKNISFLKLFDDQVLWLLVQNSQRVRSKKYFECPATLSIE